MRRTDLSGGGRRLSVDHSRCSGTGYCRDAKPDLFYVEDKRSWLNPSFDLSAADPDELWEVIAVCPWFAIELATTEEADPTSS